MLSTGCCDSHPDGCAARATTTAGNVKIAGNVRTIGIAFTLRDLCPRWSVVLGLVDGC